MPVIFICACGLILFSATDAFVRAYRWPAAWSFAVCVMLFAMSAVLIYRYTRVEMEYVWFSGELIVRRHEGGHITRIVVSQHAILGMRDRRGHVGACMAGRVHNCCATLRGRVFCSALYYHDETGRAWKLRLQPTPELRALLWAAANDAARKAKVNAFLRAQV